jgi:ankyrin repeat protein
MHYYKFFPLNFSSLFSSYFLYFKKCQYRLTPLHLAAMKSHEEICRILLEKGANIEAKTDVRINITIAILYRGFMNFRGWSSLPFLINMMHNIIMHFSE